MKKTILGMLAAMCVVACGPADKAPAVNAGFNKFVAAFMQGYFEQNPDFAVYQGRHEFDGKLPDWSEAGLNAKAAFLHKAVDDARAFKDADLAPKQRFERDYLIRVAEGDLFWQEDADQPHRNPDWYDAFDPNVYVARNYADGPTRMRAFITMAKQVPAATALVRANLKTPMPLSFITKGKASFGGLASYYLTDVKTAFADVKDAALQAELDAAIKPAAKALQDTADWLESNRASATQDFALGPERFSRMLAMTEGVTTPLSELTAIGKADLARNQAALKAACAEFAPGATIPACVEKAAADKGRGSSVEVAQRQIPELRAFVIAKDLVTIPGTEEALVREAPPYNRQNFAYIDPPGPYEKNIPSIYYIAPADPAWSKAVQDAYTSGENELLFTSAHEVMPGHFVQFLHANRSSDIFGRVFVGYAFAEGWAHYAEEMMWDAGLRNGDPKIHIGQLSQALKRDCRYLSAIGLHTAGMTQEQSYHMFRDECFQDEGNARQQAQRGTVDPAYLNYTLGKLMIRKLRDDWTATHGGRAGWKAFHDQFLSYGGPPIPLVRQQMMGGEAKAVF
ncbi:DUF885 domain-containing protein [soil metagenome]